MKVKRWMELALVCSVCSAALVVEAAPRTGYILIDASSGQRLAASAENEAFMAASTMKLATALAALDTLGPNHQFETSLSITGKLNQEGLEGDLVLHGQGDVELDLDDLMQMILTLRQSGISKVSGRFLVSDSAFLRVDNINPTQPLEAPYNAGVGPLSLAFGRATMRLDDRSNYFANPALYERGPAWQIVSDKGEKRSRAIPVQDVGMHAGHSLHRMARELGIDLPAPTRGTVQGSKSLLTTIKSKPLAEMIEGMMVYSNNQLLSAPRIKLLIDTNKRRPYPLSWSEQITLFNALPDHLADMALFAVNTGCRDSEICNLRWHWHVPVPELNTAVFIIPGHCVKNGDERLVVLNSVANDIVNKQRGTNAEHVFNYKGAPVTRMLNTAWLRARKATGLEHVRVHDLKHTYGRRLRAAGVSFEDRQDLLGHRSGRITTHYSAAELSRLLEAANSVCNQRGGGSQPEIVVLRRLSVS